MLSSFLIILFKVYIKLKRTIFLSLFQRWQRKRRRIILHYTLSLYGKKKRPHSSWVGSARHTLSRLLEALGVVEVHHARFSPEICDPTGSCNLSRTSRKTENARCSRYRAYVLSLAFSYRFRELAHNLWCSRGTPPPLETSAANRKEDCREISPSEIFALIVIPTTCSVRAGASGSFCRRTRESNSSLSRMFPQLLSPVFAIY